jgi:hypothetical protein
MSLQAKLRAAASAAALEAMQNERARCLWAADQVVIELAARLSKKLLTTEGRHTAETKLNIARAVVQELRRAIVSGARPTVRGATGQPGAAGSSSDDLRTLQAGSAADPLRPPEVDREG